MSQYGWKVISIQSIERAMRVSRLMEGPCIFLVIDQEDLVEKIFIKLRLAQMTNGKKSKTWVPGSTRNWMMMHPLFMPTASCFTSVLKDTIVWVDMMYSFRNWRIKNG